jgi:hypothetical protein
MNMRDFFDKAEAPGPLGESTDLYDYFESAVFFEGRSGQGAEAGEQLFAVWQADMEIMNGGIAQFLLNGSGDVAEDAVAGFQTFGLPEVGEVLEQAFLSLGPDEVPQDAGERRRWIAGAVGGASDFRALRDTLAERMRSFDSRYYRLKEAIDAERGGRGFLWRICAVVEAHRDDMFPSP